MADEWLSLTHALTQTMRAHAPGWTDHNDSDPGITILELIADLAESLRLHATSSEKLSSAAARAIRALEAVAAREPVAAFVTERWSGTTRPNYFFGKILGHAHRVTVRQRRHTSPFAERNERLAAGSCVRPGASAIVALSKRSRREARAAEYRSRSVLTHRAYACTWTTLT